MYFRLVYTTSGSNIYSEDTPGYGHCPAPFEAVRGTVKLKWENKHGLTTNQEFVAAKRMKIDIRTLEGRKEFDEKMSEKTQDEIDTDKLQLIESCFG